MKPSEALVAFERDFRQARLNIEGGVPMTRDGGIQLVWGRSPVRGDGWRLYVDDAGTRVSVHDVSPRLKRHILTRVPDLLERLIAEAEVLIGRTEKANESLAVLLAAFPA